MTHKIASHLIRCSPAGAGLRERDEEQTEFGLSPQARSAFRRPRLRRAAGLPARAVRASNSFELIVRFFAGKKVRGAHWSAPAVGSSGGHFFCAKKNQTSFGFRWEAKVVRSANSRYAGTNVPFAFASQRFAKRTAHAQRCAASRPWRRQKTSFFAKTLGRFAAGALRALARAQRCSCWNSAAEQTTPCRHGASFARSEGLGCDARTNLRYAETELRSAPCKHGVGACCTARPDAHLHFVETELRSAPCRHGVR